MARKVNFTRTSSFRKSREDTSDSEYPRRVFTAEQRERYAKQDRSRLDIAAELGVTPTAVTNWRRTYGTLHRDAGYRVEECAKAHRRKSARIAAEHGWPTDLRLSPTEVRVLNAVRKHGKLSTNGMCVLFYWENRTARAYVCRLRKKGMLEHAGTKTLPICYYQLTERYRGHTV